MKVQVFAHVTKVEEKKEHPLKPDGINREWLKPQIPYIETTLTILDNKEKLVGTITVREALGFGTIHKIFINIDDPMQVVDSVTDIPSEDTIPASSASFKVDKV